MPAILEVLRTASWIDRPRVLRWGTACALASLAVLACDIVIHTSGGITSVQGEFLGRDFVNFWAGARLAAHGRGALAYDPQSLNVYLKSIAGPQAELKLYSYPPVAMVLALPLAILPFVWGFFVWTVLGIACCAIPLSRLIGWRAALPAVIGPPAALIDLVTGQNGHFTAALMAGGLMLLDTQPTLAGILLGLLCFKPQIGLLIPFVLAASGRWRSFAAAAATVCLLVAASVLLLGTGSWVAFRGQMQLQQTLMAATGPYWYRTQSIFLALHNAGASSGLAMSAQAASAVAAGVLAVLVWRRDASLPIKAATLVVATFLATPYAWDYDMVALIFAAAWLGREACATAFLPWEKTVVVLLLVQPFLTLAVTAATGVQFAPLGLWFALLVIVRRALSVPASASSPALAT